MTIVLAGLESAPGLANSRALEHSRCTPCKRSIRGSLHRNPVTLPANLLLTHSFVQSFCHTPSNQRVNLKIMNNTASTLLSFLGRASESEHFAAIHTKYSPMFDFRHDPAVLTVAGVPLMVTLAILLIWLWTNPTEPIDLEPTESEPTELEPQKPVLRVQTRARPQHLIEQTAQHLASAATQTTIISAPPTPSIAREEKSRNSVARIKNNFMQQQAKWIVEQEDLRSQLSQARKKMELLLKASQLEVRTRAEGKFLAALEVVGVQEDIATFQAREKCKNEAFKKDLQQTYDQRTKQNMIAKTAAVNTERQLRVRAEVEARAMAEHRDRETQLHMETSKRLQELETMYAARDKKRTAELFRVKSELRMACKERDRCVPSSVKLTERNVVLSRELEESKQVVEALKATLKQVIKVSMEKQKQIGEALKEKHKQATTTLEEKQKEAHKDLEETQKQNSSAVGPRANAPDTVNAIVDGFEKPYGALKPSDGRPRSPSIDKLWPTEKVERPDKSQQHKSPTKQKRPRIAPEGPTIEDVPPTPGKQGFAVPLSPSGTTILESNRREERTYGGQGAGKKEDLRRPSKAQKEEPAASPKAIDGVPLPSIWHCGKLPEDGDISSFLTRKPRILSSKGNQQKEDLGREHDETENHQRHGTFGQHDATDRKPPSRFLPSIYGDKFESPLTDDRKKRRPAALNLYPDDRRVPVTPGPMSLWKSALKTSMDWRAERESEDVWMDDT